MAKHLYKYENLTFDGVKGRSEPQVCSWRIEVRNKKNLNKKKKNLIIWPWAQKKDKFQNTFIFFFSFFEAQNLIPVVFTRFELRCEARVGPWDVNNGTFWLRYARGKYNEEKEEGEWTIYAPDHESHSYYIYCLYCCHIIYILSILLLYIVISWTVRRHWLKIMISSYLTLSGDLDVSEMAHNWRE